MGVVVRRVFCFAFCLILIFALPFTAAAAETPVVVGTAIDDDSVGLFLYDAADNLSGKISDWQCDVISQGYIEEFKVPARTLFLIDVSTSMRKSSRTQINNLLAKLIENKKTEDLFAIATFGEEFKILCDFTNERFDLAKAAESLEFKDEASSIYEAVGQAADIVGANSIYPPMFTQLVVFSDGVEQSTSGIIKEELFYKLRNEPHPIHTIGFKYENNSETLKELYAVSRITGGFSFETSVDTDIMQLEADLDEYKSKVSWVQFALPVQAKDGAVRALRIYDSSGSELLKYDLHMPRVEAAAPIIEPESEPEDEPEPEPKPAFQLLWWHLVIAVVALCGIVVLIIILVRKNKKPQETEQDTSSEGTEFFGGDDEGTQFLIQSDIIRRNGNYKVVLNDLLQPHKRFEVTIDEKIEVGRSPNMPGIAIDYDKRMSKRHFSLTRRDGGIWIEDLGSTNKTFLNDEEVRTAKRIKDNDVITCGKTRFSVKILEC